MRGEIHLEGPLFPGDLLRGHPLPEILQLQLPAIAQAALLLALLCTTRAGWAESGAEAEGRLAALQLASVPIPGTADELVVDEDQALEVFLSPSDFPDALVRFTLAGASADFAMNIDVSAWRGEALVGRVQWPTLGGRQLEVTAPDEGVVPLTPTAPPAEAAAGAEEQPLQLLWFLRPEEGEPQGPLRARVEAVCLIRAEGGGTLAAWFAPPPPAGCLPSTEASLPRARCRASGVSRAVRSLSIDPSGRWVAVAGGDLRPRIDLWERSSFDVSRRLAFPPWQGPPLQATYTDDGRLLVAADAAGVLHLWEATSGGGHRRIEASASAVAVLDTGRLIAAAGDDGAIVVWRTQDGTINTRLGRQDSQRSWVRLAASADGLRLAALSSTEAESEVLVWQLEDRHLVGRIAAPVGLVELTLVGPGEFALATHVERGLLRAPVEPGARWVAFGGELGRHCQGALALNQDHSRLACALDDGGFALFETSQGRSQRSPGATEEAPMIDALAFTPDGAALVAAGGGELLEWALPSAEGSSGDARR